MVVKNKKLRSTAIVFKFLNKFFDIFKIIFKCYSYYNYNYNTNNTYN